MITGATLASATRPHRGADNTMVRVPAQERRRRDAHPMEPPGTSASRAALTQATIEAQTALRKAAAAAATAAAHARSMADVLDETLAMMADAGTTTAGVPARQPRPATDALSPREKEVLALVAEGRSNKAIAEALFVSPNTVKTHVASLLAKLHADSRVQLAAMAVRGGYR